MSERIKLSSCRRALAAMLRYAQRIPTVPVAYRMNLADVAKARQSAPASPSWSSIFVRAYGLTCARFPQLRRSWISWPRPYLHQHEHSVAAVAIEREWQGEQVVLPCLIGSPETNTLDAIQQQIRRFQQADVWSLSGYRRAIRFGYLPWFLQRLFMWHKLDISGKRRARYVGTFGFSNYGMLGAESLHPIGPTTTVMTLGPMSLAGDITVKLVYDHRVLDGAQVARCLNYVDEVLHGTILAELGTTTRLAA
jgi:pyruvate/2-oxoglutarate dehydrogenase complex dihydrolipoamide acyltransferase (E2) component